MFHKPLIFSLTFAGILAIIVTLTYHWFFNSSPMLMGLLAVEALSLTTNLAVLHYFWYLWRHADGR